MLRTSADGDRASDPMLIVPLSDTLFDKPSGEGGGGGGGWRDHATIDFDALIANCARLHSRIETFGRLSGAGPAVAIDRDRIRTIPDQLDPLSPPHLHSLGTSYHRLLI